MLTQLTSQTQGAQPLAVLTLSSEASKANMDLGEIFANLRPRSSAEDPFQATHEAQPSGEFTSGIKRRRRSREFRIMRGVLLKWSGGNMMNKSLYTVLYYYAGSRGRPGRRCLVEVAAAT